MLPRLLTVLSLATLPVLFKRLLMRKPQSLNLSGLAETTANLPKVSAGIPNLTVIDRSLS